MTITLNPKPLNPKPISIGIVMFLSLLLLLLSLLITFIITVILIMFMIVSIIEFFVIPVTNIGGLDGFSKGPSSHNALV